MKWEAEYLSCLCSCHFIPVGMWVVHYCGRAWKAPTCAWLPGSWHCLGVLYRHPATSQVIAKYVLCWLHAWHKLLIRESAKHACPQLQWRASLISTINVQSVLTQSIFNTVTWSEISIFSLTITSGRVQWLSDPSLFDMHSCQNDQCLRQTLRKTINYN